MVTRSLRRRQGILGASRSKHPNHQQQHQRDAVAVAAENHSLVSKLRVEVAASGTSGGRAMGERTRGFAGEIPFHGGAVGHG
jgi:hypothetical protein